MLRQTNVIKTLVTKYPLYNFSVRSNNKRLGNLDNVNIDTLVLCVRNTFSPSYIEVLHPGNNRNPSKKYQCILFTVDSEIFTIVNCTYENKGKVFEDDLYSLLTVNDPSVEGLFDYLNVWPGCQVLNTGKVNTARNIYGSVHNCGEIISDITLIDGKKETYLSLKAKNGTTLYSGKSINFIYEEHDTIKFDEFKLMTNPHGELFDVLEIDVFSVISGLNAYKEKTPTNSSIHHAPESSHDFVRNLLVNSWSYGYYLIYEHKNNVDAIDLTRLETVLNMVYKINGITIQYPTSKSKQLTITIYVQNNITKSVDKYMIEFRNTKGKILPLEMKVKKF